MRRRSWTLVVWCGLVLPALVGACSATDGGAPAGGPVVSATSGSGPAGSTDAGTVPDRSGTSVVQNPHQVALSEGETAELTAELVPVDGYRYTDVGEDERAASLASLPAEVSAAAFHGVVDTSTGKEIAYLALSVLPPEDAMHAPDNAETFGRWAVSADTVAEQTFSGHQVWFHEDPTRPASRYQYVWLRHGTVGWLDSADQATAEQFVTAYFEAPFRGSEPALLAERMVDVPDFAYTNAITREREQKAAAAAFPGSVATVHNLFDRTHMVGGLVLVAPAPPVTGIDLESRVSVWFMTVNGLTEPPVLLPVDQYDVDGVTVRRLEESDSGLHLFVWQWPNGVVGWVATSRPDIADPFVRSFVAAPPAPVAG